MAQKSEHLKTQKTNNISRHNKTETKFRQIIKQTIFSDI